MVGMALSVDRTYLGGQFAWGEGVTELFGGKMIAGGGWSKSLTWNGWPCMLMSVGIKGFSLWAACGTV